MKNSPLFRTGQIDFYLDNVEFIDPFVREEIGTILDALRDSQGNITQAKMMGAADQLMGAVRGTDLEKGMKKILSGGPESLAQVTAQLIRSIREEERGILIDGDEENDSFGDEGCDDFR